MPTEPENSIKNLLRKFLIILAWATVILLILVGAAFKLKLQSVTSFLMIAGAYFLSGIILGFLFGMPRSEKFRYKNSGGGDSGQNTSWYSDNTNLEDVSDWLTKIIVGLSLVNFDTILKYTGLSAKNIAISLSGNSKDVSAYSLSYAIIIAFIAAGFIISYLWAFTELRTILIKMKKNDLSIITPEMAEAISSGLSQKAVKTEPDVFNAEQIEERAKGDEGLQEFIKKVKEKLATKEGKDKSDLQKNRWGGEKVRDNKRIEGSVSGSLSAAKFFDLKLRVSSTEKANPLKGWVAFFVHDSFGFTDDVLYTNADKTGFAEVPLVAYETFTAGAFTQQDQTELEIDLNNEKGFPTDFYY